MAQNATAPKHVFKNEAPEVTLEVEKLNGAVNLYILAKDVKKYERILIERRDGLNADFSKCKEIDIAAEKIKDDYIFKMDKYPLPTNTEVTYRVKGILKGSGAIMMFPSIPLVTGK